MLFKKIAYFTDIHFGRSGNSPVANHDNLQFVEWFIDEAKSRGCDTFVFGGDFFDNRYNVHLSTLHAAIQALRMINNAFERSYFILGNHDLFFRNSREITSLEVAGDLTNITIIRDPLTLGDVTFLPWLVHDEHRVLKPKSRYIFAHLGVSGFLMNSKVAMKDGPESIDAGSFPDQEAVFTGHFHMRQQKGNIIYTGNVMPFDFSDDWDANRGAMFMEWGRSPEFVAWPDQPLFRSTTISRLLNDPGSVLAPKVTARVNMDVDLSYEEAQVIRQEFVSQFRLRKLELVQPEKRTIEQRFSSNAVCQTVDQVVISGLLSVESDGIRPNTLVDIYESLPADKN